MRAQKRGNFEVEKVPGCILVRCTTGLILTVCEELVHLVDQCLEEFPMKETAFVVLDVNQNKEVGQNFIRAAANIQKKLKSMDKDFIVINASHDWAKFVGGQGIQISILGSMNEVIEHIPAQYGVKPQGVKVDVNFVN